MPKRKATPSPARQSQSFYEPNAKRRRMNHSDDKSMMEWSSGQYMGDETQFVKKGGIVHSTPLQFRPLPTPSPNLSRINYPQRDGISKLIELLAQLDLN